MRKIMRYLAITIGLLVFLAILILPILYPPEQLPIHYYMDGPNPYIPTVDTSNIAFIPDIFEMCECGNDPSCQFPWDKPITEPKGKYDNYV